MTQALLGCSALTSYFGCSYPEAPYLSGSLTHFSLQPNRTRRRYHNTRLPESKKKSVLGYRKDSPFVNTYTHTQTGTKICFFDKLATRECSLRLAVLLLLVLPLLKLTSMKKKTHYPDSHQSVRIGAHARPQHSTAQHALCLSLIWKLFLITFEQKKCVNQ